MNQTPVWELPKSERKRIKRWRETLQARIQDQSDSIQSLKNSIDIHEFTKGCLKTQLTLLEERFRFD